LDGGQSWGMPVFHKRSDFAISGNL
jgi:hypothetical protein